MKWTKEEEEMFKVMTVREIVEKTGRSYQSVTHKKARLQGIPKDRGYDRPVPEPLSDYEKMIRIEKLCKEMRVRLHG